MRRARRAIFAAVVLVGLACFTEALSFGAFWLLDGVPFSPARLASERRAAAEDARSPDTTAPADAPPSPDDRLRAALGRRNLALHPYLGFVLDPSKPHVFDDFLLAPDDPHRKPVVVNDFGLNDPAPPLRHRSPDELIVGVFGGSVAMAFSHLGTDALAEALQGAPILAHRRMTVVDVALGGYKQPQQVLALAYLLSLGAEFDVIVNVDGFNEIALYPAETPQHDVFSAFPRGWREVAAGTTDPEFTALVGAVEFHKRRRRDLAERFQDSVLRDSPTANLVWRLRDRLELRELADARRSLRDHRPAETSFALTGPERSYADPAAMYADLVALWKHGSLQLHRLAEANGIRYVHVLQPNQHVPGSKPLTPEERTLAADPAADAWRGSVETAYPLLARAGAELREAGVEFHDLTDLFAHTTDRVYIDHCCHMNALGNHMMGDAIGRVLRDGS